MKKPDHTTKRQAMLGEQRKILISSGKNKCSRCHRTKLLKHFSRTMDGKFGYRYACKKCRKKKEGEGQKLSARKPTLARRFAHAKGSAKFRHISWSLNKSVYASLLLYPCTYCGGTLPKLGCGLDRKNNKQGYVENNVVPCCFTCNRVKGSEFSYEEMLSIGDLLRSIRLRRKTDETSLGNNVPAGTVTVGACSS